MKKIILITFILSCYFSVFANEYSLIRFRNYEGIVDEDLNVLIKPEYEIISPQKYGYICYKDKQHNREVSVRNKDLTTVFSASRIYFKRVSSKEYFYRPSFTGEAYLLNIETGEISEYVQDKRFGISQNPFSEDRIVFLNNSDYAVGDKDGNIIVDGIEDSAYCYSEGLLAVIFKDGRSGFIDKEGKLVIETPHYVDPDAIGPRKDTILSASFKDDVCILRQDKDTWKLVNKKGKFKEIPEGIQMEAYSFNKGLAAISMKENNTKKYGYMNKNLGIEIPCVFDYAENFVGNYAIVKYQGKDGLIDAKGNFYASEDLMVGIKRSIKVK